MTHLARIASACAAALLLSAGNAAAAPIVLDFEGIGDFNLIKDFYNGGAASNGASGTNYGINFSPDSIALTDSDAGGFGTLAGMPSGVGVLTYFSGGAAVLNMASGFDTRLAFHYAAGEAGVVRIYEGMNGTGNLLASIDLAANINNCPDGNNLFCLFNPVELLFNGTAHSVSFGGPDGWLVFDNVTLGSLQVNPNPVPEPASLALGALGLAGLLAAPRRVR
jgi:hypothetical protein